MSDLTAAVPTIDRSKLAEESRHARGLVLMEQSLDALDEALRALEGQLNPVTRQKYPSKEGEGVGEPVARHQVPEEASRTVESLFGFANRVLELHDMVTRIRHDLDL